MFCHLLKLFFISITIIFLYHPTTSSVVAQNANNISDPLYQDCRTSFHCGNITNITYPFWGSSRPAYCGHHHGFQLNCTNQTALIKINQLTYQILRIDSNSPTLTLARTDYITNICPTSFFNTTLDQTLFNFTSNLQNITFYYGCDARNIQSPRSPLFSKLVNELTCSVNGVMSSGYYQTGRLNSSSSGVSMESCQESVIVPAFESAASFVESNPSTENVRVALNQGFGVQWNASDSLCESCVSSGGTCGSNTTDNSFVCYCADQHYPFTCTGTQRENVKFSLPVAVIVVIVAAVVGSCLSIGFFSTTKGRFWVKSIFFGLKKTKQDEKIETFIMNYQSLIAKRYSYWDVSKMTNAFADKLGQGGFGGVYKGKLPDGRLVAVKVLNKSTGDGEEFINEVAAISRTSHVNIVNLLGFCFERTKRALIYEYMPNGSLDKYINDSNSRRLEWKTLYEIAIGIARGLEYLHRGCNTRIVHFDIKPHNILLDESLCPKIADFGLAKLCKGKESIVSMLGARGTAGYIAPEVFMRDFGGVSYKSDVYSYGMLILEMFAGKDTNRIDFGFSQTSEIYFSDWIYKHLEPGIISRVHENISEEEEETVRRMIIVGLWCIQTNPTDRPSMTKVVEMLEGSLESLQIPPKPRLFSTSNTAPKFSSIASSSLLNLWLTKEEDKALSLAEAD